MGLRTRAVLVAVCAILSHVLMPRGLAGTLGAEGFFVGLRHSSSPAAPSIDEDMVEQMWLNCSLDLMDFDEFSFLKDIIRDSHEINRRRRLPSEGSTQEAMTLMSPEIKHKFLDCLNKKNFPSGVSGGGPRNSFSEFLELLFDWHSSSRRHLADEPFQTMAPALSPAPALVPSLASAPSPNPGIDPPNYGPAPSSVPAPATAPAPGVLFLDPAPRSLYPPEYPESSPDDSPVLPSRKQKSTERSIVIAVVITAAVSSLLAAFLAYCYFRYRGNKNNSGHGRKDDKPFLTLSSGSSQKSFGQGNPINKNKLGALPFKNDPNQDIKSVETPSSEVLPGVSNSSTEPSNAPSNAPATKLPPPPAPPPPVPPGPHPPPPPKGGIPPHPPRVNQPSPLGPKQSGNAVSSQEVGTNTEANAPKAKLKPFFWDKVQANTDQSMVWDQIKAGSFQFNEEMIESLFGYNAADKHKSVGKRESLSNDPSTHYVRILDPKKSHNLAISMKALNVKTEEVCDALMEGNELPMELLQTLLRMSLSTDEELGLRLYSGDRSLLGPAEQFLKALVDIPFAFQRMDALLFMASLQEEVSSTNDSFSTLEVACKELRSSRLFLKLLEAVLKTGNRMNDGTFRGGAQAFKLDTLLKLSDVKGTDGKTTLLLFVVQEIIRAEGVRAARLAREGGSISSLNSDDFTDDSPTESGEYFCSLGLKVVSGLSSELENVKKAASLDADALTSTVANLSHRLAKTKEFLNTSMQSIEESGFHQSLKCFVEHAEADITSSLEEEKRIRSLVKSTTDYFHGNAGRDEGLHLFVIVRDFLGMLDKACKEVGELSKKMAKMARSRETPIMSPARDPREAPTMSPARDPRQLLFPAIRDRRMDCLSSDDESP